MKGFILCVIFALTYASVDKCPPGTTENVFVANPCDCSTYYHCAEGVPVLNHCPAGLEWDAKNDMCEWPELANCQESPEKCSTEAPTEATTVEDNPCSPKNNPENNVMLPAPGDCTSFIICNRGNINWVRCPPGLEYSAEKKMCTSPSEANCKTMYIC